jgi:hypothetical protein
MWIEHNALWRVAVAVALLGGGKVHAQQAEQGLDYSLRASVGYSDNLARNDGNRVSSAIYAAGGALSYARQDGRMDADIGLDLDWLQYEDSGFDSQLWGNARASVNYALLPERLVWVLQNDFGQGNIDPSATSTPDNVENLNYFTTGPQLLLHFGAAAGAVLDARYSNVWFEDSPNNSDRYSGAINVFREMSGISRVYVQANYEDVQFDDGATAPDFDQTDVLLGYTNRGARTSILVEGGYSTLNYLDDSQSGPLARLNLSRTLSDALTRTGKAGYEFNDSARDLRSQGDFGQDPNGLDSTSEVYQDLYGGVGMAFDKRRSRINGAVEYHDQDYLQADELDRTRLLVFLRFERDLNRALTGRLSLQHEQVEFTNVVGRDYDENEFAAGLRWGATPTIDVDLSYRYYERPSDSFDTFNENRIWLTGEWSPGRR